MSASVYIYYRVDRDQADQARRAVHALVTEVGRALKVSGKLLRRDSDPDTWLEVYEPVQDLDVLLAALAAGVRHHGVERFLQAGSSRVLECFVPMA